MKKGLGPGPGSGSKALAGGFRDADDASLVRACLAGAGPDADRAWETLIVRYRRLVYSIAVSSFRFDQDHADDVFQRVALKLVENLPKLRSTDALAGWISTVTRHECEAAWRDGRRQSPGGLDDAPEESTPPADVPGTIDTIEREHAVTLALERLGEPCRGLLHALYVEDPTPPYAEIAARLARPIGALGPTRARCLKKLQAVYLDLGGPPL